MGYSESVNFSHHSGVVLLLRHLRFLNFPFLLATLSLRTDPQPDRNSSGYLVPFTTSMPVNQFEMPILPNRIVRAGELSAEAL